VRLGPALVRRLRSAAAIACAAVVLAAVAPSCSLSDGLGDVSGTLNVPACWSGKFDLKPDFFAGVPYKNTLQLRIQSGGDYESFSDGLSILIDDVTQIRPSDDGTKKGLYGVPLLVSLAPGVVPPGVPIPAVASPAAVHLALYLQRSCRTQNVALYALDKVTVNADGSCDAVDGSAEPLPCSLIQPAALDAGTADASAPDATLPVDAGASPPPTPNVRTSTITFTSLFDNNPDEDIAARRLNEGTFDVYLADPREACPGGLGPPPRCRGHLTGNFRFYFQRGRPAQPFP
jgi:hypothetical protein